MKNITFQIFIYTENKKQTEITIYSCGFVG